MRISSKKNVDLKRPPQAVSRTELDTSERFNHRLHANQLVEHKVHVVKVDQLARFQLLYAENMTQSKRLSNISCEGSHGREDNNQIHAPNN